MKRGRPESFLVPLRLLLLLSRGSELLLSVPILGRNRCEEITRKGLGGRELEVTKRSTFETNLGAAGLSSARPDHYTKQHSFSILRDERRTLLVRGIFCHLEGSERKVSSSRRPRRRSPSNLRISRSGILELQIRSFILSKSQIQK